MSLKIAYIPRRSIKVYLEGKAHLDLQGGKIKEVFYVPERMSWGLILENPEWAPIPPGKQLPVIELTARNSLESLCAKLDEVLDRV